MDWKSILLSNFAQGFREGTFTFLITIWIFVVAGSELALGTYSLITSAVSLIIFYLAGRFIAKKYRKLAILLSSILLSLAIFLLLFKLTFTKLLIYGIIISIAFPILMVPLLSMSFDVIGKAKNAAEWRIEYVVGRELFLNGGRICSIFIFILGILLFKADKIFPYILVLFGNVQLLIYFFVRRIHL